MPNFQKTEDELETDQDKWLFLFKNLHKLQEVPPRLQERIFLRLFEKASIAKFTRDERQSYENSLKYYRDMKNVIDTHVEEAKEKGREEGRAEGRAEGREEGKLEGKLEMALKMVRRFGVSVNAAAEEACVSVNELMDYIKQHEKS